MTDFDEFGLIRKLSKNCTPAKCNSIYFKSTIYEREREREEKTGVGAHFGVENLPSLTNPATLIQNAVRL